MVKTETRKGKTLIEILAPEIETKKEEKRAKTKNLAKTERGLHKESKISLWELTYNGMRRMSVFVYPADYLLTDNGIKKLDSGFSGRIRMKEFREFKEISFENLNNYLVSEVKPLQSIFDRSYSDERTPIFEHLYSDASEFYLAKVISDLKDK